MELKEPTFTNKDVIKMSREQVSELKKKLREIKQGLFNIDNGLIPATKARQAELLLVDLELELRFLDEITEE